MKKLKNSFFLGTNKGSITHYNMHLSKSKKYKISDEELRCITTDSNNLLIFILTNDGILSIFPQDESMENGPKKCLMGIPS